MIRPAAIVLVSLLAPVPAVADSFDKLLEGATTLSSSAEIGSLFWAHAVDCASYKDDLERRQCRGLVAARGRVVDAGVYWVVGEGRVTAGTWNPKKHSLAVSVDGCIDCEQGFTVEGARHYATATEATVAKGVVGSAPMTSFSLPFKTKGAADAFATKVAPTLRTEYVFRVPAKPKKWKRGGAVGYAVKLVGYRVSERCTGRLLAAKPSSTAGPRDHSACQKSK